MIAAIYARKSTDQSAVSDDQKSVARQIEHAMAYARAKGWEIADEHVYVDDGISGAEFAARPGYMRLLNSLKPRASFTVLIVSELSRIGREQFETGYAVKQLSQAGVRIFAYLEDREVLLDSPTDKFLMSAVNFAAEIERDKARQRMVDAMSRKARAGHVTGGATFGYRNEEVNGPDGRRSHVTRVVDSAQAAVVRRIFALCAGGKGVKGIAKALNAEGVASPRPQQGRPRGWAPSSVRAVLYREAYRGVAIYNKTRQSNTWGQHACLKRDAGEWIRTEAPHLRVVTEEEWAAAHKRLDTVRAIYIRGENGHVWGRPVSGIASKYLLSGSMRCACCGANMTVRSGTSGKRRAYVYKCAFNDQRGATVCANSLTLPMPAADDAILTKLKDYILNPEVIEGAILDAVNALRPSREAVEVKQEALRAELQRIDESQARFVAAIAVAGHVEALARALAEGEHRREAIRRELASIDGACRPDAFDASKVERELRKRVGEWRELLGRQAPVARQIVAKLLDGRIEWTPDREAGQYRFSGRVKYDKLLSGIVLTEGVASPPGFEPGFWP